MPFNQPDFRYRCQIVVTSIVENGVLFIVVHTQNEQAHIRSREADHTENREKKIRNQKRGTWQGPEKRAREEDVRQFTCGGRLAFDQSTFDCPDNDLGTRGEAKLVEDIAYVSLNGALGYPQRLGNLTISFALSHQRRHLAFAQGQAIVLCRFKEVIWARLFSRPEGGKGLLSRAGEERFRSDW